MRIEMSVRETLIAGRILREITERLGFPATLVSAI
jgi:hypothetical protein